MGRDHDEPHPSPPHGLGSSDGPTASTPPSTRSQTYASFLAQRARTVLLINVVGMLEKMDEALVPALSRPLGCYFNAGPQALGMITFARSVVQAVASPIGGLAGHWFDRSVVLAVGCFIWGTFCGAFAFCRTVQQVRALPGQRRLVQSQRRCAAQTLKPSNPVLAPFHFQGTMIWAFNGIGRVPWAVRAK